MVLRVVVHDAEEGGYWAEVPAIPGCFTQGESLEELKINVQEAITGCMMVMNKRMGSQENVREILDIAV